MSVSGAIAYFVMLGGMVGLAAVLLFGLRAVKLL